MTLIGFRPRPDNIELHDQQTSFLNSKHPGVTWLLHGNGAGGTTLAVAKMLNFLKTHEPHFPNCPFHVFGDSYPLLAREVWDKLLSMDDGSDSMFDKSNIRWRSESSSIPLSVPMKSSHWRIDFTTISPIGARSCGGFLVTGQPKWEVLQELIRSTREFTFTGNKIVEMTPLPRKPNEPKHPLQVMEESGTLPDGWAVYHMSTQAALNHSQINNQWFGAFFTITDPVEHDARIWGAWPK